MTTEQLKENIEDGLERLRASYDACMQGYNRARLKDLAHDLRYWTDMRNQVDRYLTENRPTAKFWTYSICNDFARKIRDCQHVIVNFPKSVTTTVLPNLVSFQRPGVRPENNIGLFLAPVTGGQQITFSFHNTKLGGQLYSVKHLIFLYDSPISLDAFQPDPRIDNMCFAYKKARFGSWLDQLAVRVNKKGEDGKLVMHNLSRETVARRVANVLGGSHPEGAIEIDNDNNPIIRYLMEFKVLELPLPYTVLLKMAHDILVGFNYL